MVLFTIVSIQNVLAIIIYYYGYRVENFDFDRYELIH